MLESICHLLFSPGFSYCSICGVIRSIVWSMLCNFAGSDTCMEHPLSYFTLHHIEGVSGG